MLIQFNFSNYRSFKDENSLDLSATGISELPSHVIESGGDKVLTFAAIFGANASGKSNVYKAFDFMTDYVLYSFSYGGNSSNSKEDSSDIAKTVPFLFDKEAASEPSSFEVIFTDPRDQHEHTYQYGFSLRNDQVVEEWLYVKVEKSGNDYKTVFYRGQDGSLDTEGLSEKDTELIKRALEPEALIVSLGAKLRIWKLRFIREWFINNDMIDYGDPDINYTMSHLLPDNFVKDRNVQNDVLKFLATFDDSIKDFIVQKIPGNDGDNKTINYDIKAVHKMADSVVAIPLEEESSGTLKMFSLYSFLKDAFEYGSVMFVDELNAKLHPLLIRNIILAFADPEINKNHAQLIFTTHDVWQLSNDILRRDEIWITAKDRSGSSELYSIVEFKDEDSHQPGKDESLAKHYMYGEYGGIPALSSLDVLKGDADEEGKKKTGKKA